MVTKNKSAIMKEEVTEYLINIELYEKFEQIYNDNPGLSIRALSSKSGLADKTCQKYKKIKLWGLEENTEKPNII